MFRNNYQGGAVVEVFSGQGKDPVAKWKLSGGPSSIHKEYNKEVKGFVYCLEGSSQTVKMQMPENGKMSLGLLQRFLVLQVNIPHSKDFSIELVITDSEHLKRRLHLSTVHKELSATMLHAKIPFVELKRNIWSTLCIDLVSFTGELFKGFVALDAITLFATCRIRRIFTMKTKPTDEDVFVNGAGVMDMLPRSCQFPRDVEHVTQVLNMEALQRAGLSRSERVSDQPADARSSSYRRARPQGVLHTASGSRVSGPPSLSGRKSSAATDGMDTSVLSISNTIPPSTEMNQRVNADSQRVANLREDLAHTEPSCLLVEGTPGSVQPHPPKDRAFDKRGSKKLRVYGVGREKVASADAVSGGHRKISTAREKCAPSSKQESRQQPLTSTEMTERQTAESPTMDSSGVSSAPAESPSCSIRPRFSSDLQVCSSWESNEGSEPRLSLQGEVFNFLSQPHSPKRGQGRGEQEDREMEDARVQGKVRRRYEAQPEDDFIGSESDEDKSYTAFQHQRATLESNPASPRSANLTSGEQHEAHPEPHDLDRATPKELSPASARMRSLSIGSAEPAGIVPTRCLSPSRQEDSCGPHGSAAVNRSVERSGGLSLSRRLLQEVKLDGSVQHKDEDDDEALKLADSLHLLSSLRMHGDDDEELRMLASLKREQDEDECRASGLSASQIHQCNVSISMSSDDASTWTHIATPANQGHHYQKEMNPLLQSNPREWMDVLSPPIIPPSQLRRSGDARNNRMDIIRGGDESRDEDENEDGYLNLLYDPCLNCYFDPKTGKYYELA